MGGRKQNRKKAAADFLLCAHSTLLLLLLVQGPKAVTMVLMGASNMGFKIDRATVEKLVAHFLSCESAQGDQLGVGNVVKALGDMRQTLPREMFRSLFEILAKNLASVDPTTVSQVLLGSSMIAESHSTDFEIDASLLEELVGVIISHNGKNVQHLSNTIFEGRAVPRGLFVCSFFQ